MKKILVIDDEPEMRKNITNLMANHYHLLLRTPQANLSVAIHANWRSTSLAVAFVSRRARLS